MLRLSAGFRSGPEKDCARWQMGLLAVPLLRQSCFHSRFPESGFPGLWKKLWKLVWGKYGGRKKGYSQIIKLQLLMKAICR